MIEIRVPRLGWSMEEGEFVGWLKRHGDAVKAGEPLYTLQGDKAAQDVEATHDGTLQLLPEGPAPGSVVVVGALLGHLRPTASVAPNRMTPSAGAPLPAIPSPTRLRPAVETISEGTQTAGGTRQVVPSSSARVPARSTAIRGPARIAISPRALRSAAALGVDWTRLQGTGRSGRIREQDVLAAAAGQNSTTAAGPTDATRSRITLPARVPAGNVVITDWTFSDLSIEEQILRPLGVTTLARQCKSQEDLVALVAEADVVITQFARVNADVIAGMRRARAIIRYGIGVDNIDLAAARAKGIPVANVPDYCIDEVADQALAFILSLTRQVIPYHRQIAEGRWGLALPIESMRALSGLTVGVIGCGRIGREVVRRLLPFKCEILAFDPMLPQATIASLGAKPVATLDQLLPQCDLLTLHCPSTEKTRKMFNAARFAQLKSGALFVNVSRGDLVETDALLAALEQGKIAAAALDVFDPEPLPADHPLRARPNVVLAPHIASVSARAVRTLRETVAILAALSLAQGLPPNVVNNVTSPRLF